MMITDNFIQNMFTVVDAKDGHTLADMITEEGLLRFANIPEVRGRGPIAEFLDNFFKSIKGIAHKQVESWKTGHTRFAAGWVTYIRHDDSTLTVPFSVILKMQEDLIAEYLIYVDASTLYK